jgi:hypothetical protein
MMQLKVVIQAFIHPKGYYQRLFELDMIAWLWQFDKWSAFVGRW